ncbi:VOC family protein [Hymenobacter sp. YC55]|uniref:VOC family protein n=1 Tax=Hymenobacter sp. YC55 TaxID=3034019 RepID=UPI0023F6ABD7|nr:VOC family protein [Hymenobacter sp. YC55]MDF7812948.1 VOC family protein [Hymenobacter sp. YC55]
MKTPQLTPYLIFKDNCRAAMQFYQQCLGGQLDIQTFTGTPAAEHVPADAQDGVLHARLENENIVLFGSDAGSQPVMEGNNVALSLNCGSDEEIESYYARLTEGGNVTMPLADTFWSAKFAMFTDQFGISWMLNYDKNEAGQ